MDIALGEPELCLNCSRFTRTKGTFQAQYHPGDPWYWHVAMYCRDRKGAVINCDGKAKGSTPFGAEPLPKAGYGQSGRLAAAEAEPLADVPEPVALPLIEPELGLVAEPVVLVLAAPEPGEVVAALLSFA